MAWSKYLVNINTFTYISLLRELDRWGAVEQVF
jgi:hypothetical protein